MPARTPSYCLHKATGQAVVRINGRDHYLGKHGSAESRAEYDRLIGEWLANGRAPVARPALAGPTVDEVLLAHDEHARRHYSRSDGRPDSEFKNIQHAVRPLRRLYGDTQARDFGPLALRAVREAMVKTGLARSTVNARINRIRRVFKWAASVELLPASVYQSLQTLQGLQAGRTEAREAPGVKPVPVALVEAALPHMPAPVAAMVRLQLLTGCRTGEVLAMRVGDLTPGEPNWEYRPGRHKNTWRGHDRVIPLGPRAQAVVRPFLKPDTAAYLFAPRDVVHDLHVRRGRVRKSKPTPSERKKRAPEPGSGHRGYYDRRSYRQAIVRACDKAFPHPSLEVSEAAAPSPEDKAALKAWRQEHRWTPAQLRHTAATLFRRRYGLEASQVVLGHAKADTTQIYAERDLAKAHQIMAEIG